MKRIINLYPSAILFSILIFLSSCNSIQKLVDQGRYDEAFALAARKLQGKKKKKTKYVLAMETAFERLTERDLRKIKNLDAPQNPKNWEKTIRVYNTINDRQEMLDPLLPLYDKNGYKADFRFVKVDELLKDAKFNAAAFLYKNSLQLLARAEKGDKDAARKAHENLNKVEWFSSAYPDVHLLQQKARKLGLTRVFVKMENKSRAILPAGFEEEVLRISTEDLNSEWHRYYTNADSGTDFDFNITLNLTNIDISPERILEREYIDEQEIRDGFEYVLDENGNVLKDSLGNDIKTDRFVTIRAFVLETVQTKDALVSGYIDYHDNRENQKIRSENFAVESHFRNCASTFRGDRRALSRQSKINIGNVPLPFPSDENLLLDAATELKNISKSKIKYNSIAGL